MFRIWNILERIRIQCLISGLFGSGSSAGSLSIFKMSGKHLCSANFYIHKNMYGTCFNLKLMYSWYCLCNKVIKYEKTGFISSSSSSSISAEKRIGTRKKSYLDPDPRDPKCYGSFWSGTLFIVEGFRSGNMNATERTKRYMQRNGNY